MKYLSTPKFDEYSRKNYGVGGLSCPEVGNLDEREVLKLKSLSRVV